MDLDKCVKQILVKHPFYGLFLLNLNRYFSDEVPTAAVGRNGINTELLINRSFWESLSDEKQIAVILHELNHVLFKHILMQKDFSNKETFNISADLEVNSYIPELQCDPYEYPQLYNFELKKGTKWYYENLPDRPNNEPRSYSSDNSGDQDNKSSDSSNNQNSNSGDNNGKGGSIVYNPNESHSRWNEFSDLSDAEKELVSKQIDFQVKNTAEQISKMRGTIPGQFQEYINDLFKQKPPVFNWKAYFRRMLGYIIDIQLKKTRKKDSVRFPDATGIKHKKKSSMLVAIDTSGSVSSKELCDFFSEINHIYRAGADITILEFDSKIQRIYKYEGSFNGKVSGRGGTSFYPAWEYYRNHIRDFNSLVIFTDGYAPTNNLVPLMNTIWIITSNGNKENKYIGKTVFIPK